MLQSTAEDLPHANKHHATRPQQTSCMHPSFPFICCCCFAFAISVGNCSATSTMFSGCIVSCAALAAPRSRISKTTPVGFEPTRGDPIGLAGRRLNRSAKVSSVRPREAMTLSWHRTTSNGGTICENRFAALHSCLQALRAALADGPTKISRCNKKSTTCN